jgi:Protein of unknown function (DUF3987)
MLSATAQGQVNARQDQQLVGPISPCLLAVADSGEHKTGCTAAFCPALPCPALRDCDAGQRQEMSSAVARHDAACVLFDAKQAGIVQAIQHKRRGSRKAAGEERELQALAGDAAVAPLVPRLA